MPYSKDSEKYVMKFSLISLENKTQWQNLNLLSQESWQSNRRGWGESSDLEMFLDISARFRTSHENFVWQILSNYPYQILLATQFQ